MRLAVVGAGVFGLATAIEGALRGHDTTVFEQGEVPNRLASSTDVAKAMRRTWYAGDNDTYVALAELSAERWHEWESSAHARLLHRTGALVVVSEFAPGTAMYESHRFLVSRGAPVEVLDAARLRERFPMFAVADHHVGVYDSWAGYIESGRAVATMADIAADAGATLRTGTEVEAIEQQGASCRLRAGGIWHRYDAAVVCAGAWLPRLVPEARGWVRVTRQEMLLFEPATPRRWRPPAMPVWALDPDTVGWYGFPLLAEGVAKVALDPPGPPVDAHESRAGSDQFRAQALAFLQRWMPALGSPPPDRVEGRACLYTSSVDDHFIIDALPGYQRVFIAGAGSGHGFKFGGSIGPVIVDAVESRDNSLGERFRIGNRFAAAELTSVGGRRGFGAPEQLSGGGDETEGGSQ